MELPDLGIFLEIVGFMMYIMSAKNLPEGSVLVAADLVESKKLEKITKFWKLFYYELDGHVGQLSRVFSLFLIIIGLLFQFSFLK